MDQDDLCCPAPPCFDITPDMENPNSHLLFCYNVDLDENWFKIVRNFSTAIAVVERNHAKLRFGRMFVKRQWCDDLLFKLEMFSVPHKGLLVVDNFTSVQINQALKDLSGYLHVKQGEEVPCWYLTNSSGAPRYLKFDVARALYGLIS